MHRATIKLETLGDSNGAWTGWTGPHWQLFFYYSLTYRSLIQQVNIGGSGIARIRGLMVLWSSSGIPKITFSNVEFLMFGEIKKNQNYSM